MGNKVKFNLKNVHAAKLTEKEEGGSTKFEYGVPKAIPGAVSISLDAEGESSPFYADGIVYFRSVTNNGYSGDLEMALIPEWFRTEILQEKLDAKGVLVENSSVAESVKFALLFEFDGDINAIRHVLYNCSASRPSIESETKEDTIEPGTETLSITADPRSDGLVKARTGDTTDETTYKEWYKTVYTPRLYRAKFKRDIFKDLSKLEKSYVGTQKDGAEFQIDDLEIFENVAYIMAYHADNSIPSTIEEWLDQFDMFSIYEVLPQILELWGDNVATDIKAKKGLAEVSGR